MTADQPFPQHREEGSGGQQIVLTRSAAGTVAQTATVAPPPLVIGVDLSLTCTGIAGASWTDHVRPRGLTGHPRLAHLIQHVGSFIRHADLVVFEGPSYGPGAKHRHEDLAGLRVIMRHWCWKRSIPYAVVPPSCRALYATGRGNATKGEVRTAIADRYGIHTEGRARYDEADAFVLCAAGLHHLGHPLAPAPERNATALNGCTWPQLEGLAA